MRKAQPACTSCRERACRDILHVVVGWSPKQNHLLLSSISRSKPNTEVRSKIKFHARVPLLVLLADNCLCCFLFSFFGNVMRVRLLLLAERTWRVVFVVLVALIYLFVSVCRVSPAKYLMLALQLLSAVFKAGRISGETGGGMSLLLLIQRQTDVLLVPVVLVLYLKVEWSPQTSLTHPDESLFSTHEK